MREVNGSSSAPVIAGSVCGAVALVVIMVLAGMVSGLEGNVVVG